MRIKSFAGAAAATAFAASLALASPAAAAVSIDAATGIGFVGKGDVQTAFAWNNAQLQRNAADVAFSHSVSDTYAAVCTWMTGQGTRGEKTHDVNHARTTSVTGAVAFDARTKTQVTGFNLTGFGDTATTGSIPVEGGACPGNEGHAGVWTSIQLTGSVSGLYVNHGGSSVQLPL